MAFFSLYYDKQFIVYGFWMMDVSLIYSKYFSNRYKCDSVETENISLICNELFATLT